LRWPDWRLPADPVEARQAFVDLWQRSATERVEVACTGGRGRTGTALACLAILDGVPAADALAYVRRHYHPRAVETPWQRWFVARFQVRAHRLIDRDQDGRQVRLVCGADGEGRPHQ
jgi:hypothetical protein